MTQLVVPGLVLSCGVGIISDQKVAGCLHNIHSSIAPVHVDCLVVIAAQSTQLGKAVDYFASLLVCIEPSRAVKTSQ